jgi:hypothetical protein
MIASNKAMQLRHTITLLGLSLLSILFQSCADFLDVNDNPNAPVSENLPLSAKLPAALVASVNQEQGQLNQLGALWGGYWGTSSEGINSFFHQKNYNGPGLRDARDGYPIWETTYTNLLYYQLIREQAEQEGEPFYEGMAKIMQGWHFLRLVDTYNNVPYEEALRGTANATPRYESGEEVYQKAMNLITEGITAIQLSPAAQAPGNDDVLFKGTKTLWAKFGNSVKLRALIRQSETGNTGYISAELGKIATEGSGFLAQGQHALVQPGYLQTAGKMNPFYESYYRNVQQAATANYQDIRPTTFVLDRYRELNDPRLGQLYVAVNGSYNGVIFGDPVVNQALYGRANTSALKGPLENNGQPAGLLKSPTQASVLMGSFESLFLQAEAAQRGWISQSAEELYNAAITESFVYLGLDGAAADEYLNQPEVAYQGTLGQLILQKWLSLNSISSIEAWNDFRRLGMPQFPNSLAINNPSVRPQRLMYPETERMTNLDEVVSQGDDQVTTAKVWWAK